MAQQDMQWPSEDEDFDAVSGGKSFTATDFEDDRDRDNDNRNDRRDGDDGNQQEHHDQSEHQEHQEGHDHQHHDHHESEQGHHHAEQQHQAVDHDEQRDSRQPQFESVIPPSRRVAPATNVQVVSEDEAEPEDEQQQAEPEEDQEQEEQEEQQEQQADDQQQEQYDDQPEQQSVVADEEVDSPDQLDDQPEQPVQAAVKPPKVKSKGKSGGSFLRGAFELILIGAVALLGLWVWKLNTDNNNLNKQVTQLNQNPQVAVQKQTQSLINQVGALMQLPQGETPTVADVSDAGKAKQQSAFFNNAQNGDKVLMYVKAGEAILYRPSTDKIVLVAPLTFTSSYSSTTPSTGTSSTATTK
jgi:hypothetical protein